MRGSALTINGTGRNDVVKRAALSQPASSSTLGRVALMPTTCETKGKPVHDSLEAESFDSEENAGEKDTTL